MGSAIKAVYMEILPINSWSEVIGFVALIGLLTIFLLVGSGHLTF